MTSAEVHGNFTAAQKAIYRERLSQKKKNPGRSRGSVFSVVALSLLLLLRRLVLRLRRELELHLRVAGRGRGDFLGAHVLEHHEVVRRVFLGQAGAGLRS